MRRVPTNKKRMTSIIDIHSHFVSRDLITEAARHGMSYAVEITRDPTGLERLVLGGEITLRPFFPELCDLDLRLPGLMAAGIDRQILSTWTDMAGDLLPPKEGARWARLQNETLAAAARHPSGKFEAMGTLPLQDVTLTLHELNYIVNNLGIRSVEIGTNVNGRDLDHPDFNTLWHRLSELDVFVFLHPPLVPVGGERTNAYFLNNLLGYPIDTTIAAARLIFSGLMSRLPGLKCCLAHGGGFLPYQIGRLDRGFVAHPACHATLDLAPSEVLRAFYYDTLTHDDAALEYLAQVVGPGKLLYGSDYPFEMLDEAGPNRIRRLQRVSAGGIEAVLGGNAEKVLGASTVESRP